MNKKFEQRAATLEIDIPELLSRKVVDTTINEIVLRVKTKNENENKIILWQDFINDLKEYNDIEKLHKTDTKYKSKNGKSIVGFDLWKGHPIIWFADNDNNCDAIRINGMKQYAISCTRTYSTLKHNTPVLRNKLVITDQSIAYLFVGGFGVSENSRKVKSINNGELEPKKIKESWVPLNWTMISVPDYITEQFRVGTYEHHYGVLPAMEMLNKDWVNSGRENNRLFIGEDYSQDICFSDWYPARDIIELLNGYIQYFASETILDHTRIIGTFSQQDINSLTQNDSNENDKMKDFINAIQSRTKKVEDVINNNETNIIMKRLILKSIGGESSQLDKMQSTLKGLEHTQTIDQLITLAFKISGYSWDTDAGKVYENVSQTMNSSKGVYESTKEKIVLYERQWKEFYSKCAFAWFKDKGTPFSSIQECIEEFEKYVEFNIVSNVLQQENNDYQKVVELSNSGLISKYKAIKDLNPDMSEEDLLKEVERIEEQDNKQQEKWDNFSNRDYLGYEENENPAWDNMGQKNVNGDN